MDIQKNENNSSNTIDLNSPNQKSVESNYHTSRVAPVKPPNKKKKWILFGIGAAVLVVVITFFSYRYYQQRVAEENTKNSKIVIGDTTITQDDIQRYIRSAQTYKTNNPSVAVGDNLEQVAIDDLVMNAALKKEAKENKLSLTDQELRKIYKIPDDQPEFKSQIEFLRTTDQPEYYQNTNSENFALREKLNNTLIARKSLFYVSVNFDTPYFYLPENISKSEELHKQAKDILTSQFLPLFEKGESNQEIAKKASVNYTVSNPQNSDTAPFFKGIVSTADYMKNYQSEIQSGDPNVITPLTIETLEPSESPSNFKDLQDVDYGARIDDLRNTNKEIDKLSNIGDHTGVFASKSGAFMIVRLDKKSDGRYTNWQDFLDQYKEQSVPSKFEVSRNDQPNNISQAFIEGATSTLYATTAQKAKATVPPGGCGEHVGTFRIIMINTNDWTQTVWGRVSMRQPTVDCPGGSASSNFGDASFQGNCYNPEPSHSFTVPTGWEYVKTVRSDWRPSNINGIAGIPYQVYIHVRPKPPTTTTVGGDSQLVRSDTGNLFGAGASISSHTISKGNSAYSNTSSSISHTWAANIDQNYTICSSAPATITTSDGRVYSRRDSDGVKCRNNIRNGNRASFSWIYDPSTCTGSGCGPTSTTCQSIGASISASPTSINQGQTATITWNGGNATGATSNFGSVNVSGSRQVSPTTTTTYTITWNSPSGTASCSTTVNVGPVQSVDVCLDIPGNQPPFPPGREPDGTGNCPFTYYPWFQTQKGDVTSLDIIQGQSIGPNNVNDPPLGAKHAINNVRYDPAEAYGVIAYGSLNATPSRKSGNFCSQSLYILGESESNRKICSSSYLGGISYGRYISDTVSFDVVRESINSTWNTNDAGTTGACSPYKTTLLNTINSNPVLQGDMSPECPGGNLIKVDTQGQPTNLTAASGLTGRATLWIAGDLNIKSNIEYSTAVSTISNLPNLAIFVEGKITIDPSVTRIDAMLISDRDIETCSDSADKSTGKCSEKLTINGAMSSLNGRIALSRRYFSANDPNANPAESVILTPQSIIMPPPGLSIVGVESGGDLQINKIELPPRI